MIGAHHERQRHLVIESEGLRAGGLDQTEFVRSFARVRIGGSNGAHGASAKPQESQPGVEFGGWLWQRVAEDIRKTLRPL